MDAYEDMLTKCNTEYAPWYIIPADNRWYRNFIITQTIVDTLDKMDLKFPKIDGDLKKVTIPD